MKQRLQPAFINEVSLEHAGDIRQVSRMGPLDLREGLRIKVIMKKSGRPWRAMKMLRSLQPGSSGIKSSGEASSIFTESWSLISEIASKKPAGYRTWNPSAEAAALKRESAVRKC